MKLWDNVPIIAALLLASAAALTSGDTQAREQVADFVAEALRPPAADAGDDTGYLLEASTGTLWPLPPRATSALEAARD